MQTQAIRTASPKTDHDEDSCCDWALQVHVHKKVRTHSQPRRCAASADRSISLADFLRGQSPPQES